MNDNKGQPTGEDIRMSDFSQVMALIFVTVVIVGSVIDVFYFFNKNWQHINKHNKETFRSFKWLTDRLAGQLSI